MKEFEENYAKQQVHKKKESGKKKKKSKDTRDGPHQSSSKLKVIIIPEIVFVALDYWTCCIYSPVTQRQGSKSWQSHVRVQTGRWRVEEGLSLLGRVFGTTQRCVIIERLNSLNSMYQLLISVDRG